MIERGSCRVPIVVSERFNVSQYRDVIRAKKTNDDDGSEQNE